MCKISHLSLTEDDRVVLGQDEFGFAWEGSVFRAADGEAEAGAVEHGAQGELRSGVTAADAGHDRGAFGGGEDIGHGRRGEHSISNAKSMGSVLADSHRWGSWEDFFPRKRDF
jgi:hypothetical protein